MSILVCHHCHVAILGPYIIALGKTWHPEHFVCADCQRPFSGDSFFTNDGKAYCENDFYERFSPPCTICNVPMRENHLVNDWGEAFCARHVGQLPTCFSCGRLASYRGTGGARRYEDGRTLCNLCRATAIDDVQQGMPVLYALRRWFSRIGCDLHNVPIPLWLVPSDDLIRLAGRRDNDPVEAMVRTQLTLQGETIVARGVQALVMLHGLPRAHMAATLAHELGHVWLFLNGFPELAPVVEEGLCEYWRYLWLREQGSPDANYRLKYMNNNVDTTYGRGFRMAMMAAQNRSLHDLLDYVREHRRFPAQVLTS